MIIGVDGGALSIVDPRLKVGVYQVTYQLLRELGALDKENTYRIYSYRSIKREVMGEFGGQIKNVVLRPSVGWAQLRLPIELLMHPVDVFLGLSQLVSFSTSYNIGFVYDLGFLHDPSAYPDSYTRLKRQTDTLVRRASRIVTISDASAQDIQGHYHIPGESISVCYPGVGQRFAPKGPRYQHPRPYFLFVGALKRQKNIPMALKAFAQFLKTIKEPYDFLLVGGDRWLDPEIEKTIRSLHLVDRVQRLGFVPDHALPKLYRGAVAFVSPSFWEGFCLPAVEAMACRCPVVCSSVGAFPEVVGSAGILVDPYDTTGLSRALEGVATRTSYRKQLAIKGLERSRLFSWKAFAQGVYEQICLGRRVS